MDFEKKLSRLEQIVTKMEKGDIALEESLKLFEEGIKLSRECHGQLEQAEAQVKKLVGFDGNGKPLTELFKTDSDEE